MKNDSELMHPAIASSEESGTSPEIMHFEFGVCCHYYYYSLLYDVWVSMLIIKIIYDEDTLILFSNFNIYIKYSSICSIYIITVLITQGTISSCNYNDGSMWSVGCGYIDSIF
jgi:hypothetical protein